MDRSILGAESRPMLTGTVAPDAMDDAAANNRTTIRDLWRTLVRRRNVFFAILIAFPLLVTWCTLIIPRNYTTVAKLMTGPAGQPQTQPQSELPVLNQLMLCPHHITNRDHRKIHPIRMTSMRIYRRRACATIATAQNI